MKPSDMADSRTLYEKIRTGTKTSEWRNFSPYWQKMLLYCENLKALSERPIDCTKDLRVHKAWFVQGYPKGNLPRLEADIVRLTYYPQGSQFEISFVNVNEIGQ
jgi:hypothetical protein